VATHPLPHTALELKLLPVLTVSDPDQAVALCRALKSGGIKGVEITLRTPAAVECLAAVKKALPDLLVAAGTVTTPEQVSQVVAAGADFGVSPAASDRLLRAVVAAGLPFVPGVATPTEALQAWEYGFSHLKLFPATAVGGLTLLQSMAAPLPNLMFCPTGGLNQTNFRVFLELPNVFCVGGSWMIPKTDLTHHNWQAITEATQTAWAMAN